MIVLENGDLLRGDATTAAEVDFTVHGLDNNALTQLADGQLANSIGTLYTSNSTDVVTSVIYVNTGAAHNHVNLYITPAAGTARRMIPKDLQLESGYSLHFEGGKCTVLTTGGAISQTIDTTLFLDDTAGGTDALVTKAPTSNAFYDHARLAAGETAHGLVAATNPAGATLLHVMASVNGATAWSVVDIFDVTVPSTQAIGDAAVAGTATTAAHRDHVHAMPSAATMNTASVAAVAAAGFTLATTKNIVFTSPGALVIPTLATTLADGEWVGITCPGVIGTAAGQIFGDLCYFNPATNEWLLTDADAVATALGTLGICLAAGNENAASTYLLWGRVRADAAFPALTALTTTYMSGTLGDITETAPTGSIGIIRCVGFSVNANELFFQPSTDYFTLVA